MCPQVADGGWGVSGASQGVARRRVVAWLGNVQGNGRHHGEKVRCLLPPLKSLSLLYMLPYPVLARDNM